MAERTTAGRGPHVGAAPQIESVWCDTCRAIQSASWNRMAGDDHDATDLLCGACASVIATLTAGVPCFVKQMGHRVIGNDAGFHVDRWILNNGNEFEPPIIGPMAHKRPPGVVGFTCWDRKGGDPDDWPEDLRVREFPA